MIRKLLPAMVFASFPALALADDRKLEAALRRIEALESRMEHISVLETENRELREKLGQQTKPLPSARHVPRDAIATKLQSDAQTNWEGIYGALTLAMEIAL